MDTFLLVVRVALSLAVVVVLLWMAQKRWAKGSRPGAQADLEVVSRRSVGQKASVVMVDVGGQRFLLGVTEHAISVLHSAPAPERAPEAVFAQSLQEAGHTPKDLDDGGTLPLRARHQRPQPAPLAGSILSPQAWQQAGAAVRKGLKL